MAAVALAIYLPRYAREQQKIQAEAQQRQAAANETAAQAKALAAVQAQQAQERAAAEARQAAEQKAAANLAAYRSRYLNSGFARKSGFKNVAIAAATGDEPNHPIAEALASRLENENLVLFTSFFKPAFYSDGLFNEVFSGSSQPIDKLQLTNTLDALLLAQEQVEYSTNGVDLDYVITARVRLDVAFLPLDEMRRQRTLSFTASGAGFSQGEALKNADDRLI